jgi:hypothetical protein
MILHKLSITMPHRVMAVIEADGWHTKSKRHDQITKDGSGFK